MYVIYEFKFCIEMNLNCYTIFILLYKDNLISNRQLINMGMY